MSIETIKLSYNKIEKIANMNFIVKILNVIRLKITSQHKTGVVHI